MSDLIFAENHIKFLQKTHRISSEQSHVLLSLLQQEDKYVVSLFKTLEWSSNEDAFLEKIHQIHVPSKDTSNFSTETSLRPKSRPSSIIVPFNRELKYYLSNDCGNTSIEENIMKSKEAIKKKKEKKPVFLSKIKCSYDLKFESDVEDQEKQVSQGNSSFNSLDQDISSENKENALCSVTNFFFGNKEKQKEYQTENHLEKNQMENQNQTLKNPVKNQVKNQMKICNDYCKVEKMMEKKMSIDEILQKYDMGIDNEVEEVIDENEKIVTNEKYDDPLPIIKRKF